MTMKRSLAVSLAVLFGLLMAIPCSLRSDETKDKSGPSTGSAKSDEKKTPAIALAKIIYNPPKTGAPKVRVDGGTRGDNDNLPTLSVLAPDHVALTTQEQPTLYWYQSKPARLRFELTLLEENKNKPVLVVKIDSSDKSGIQSLKLSEHQLKLVTGVEYEWAVALVADPENRSKDIICSSVIKRVEPSPALASKLAKAGKPELAAIYAEEGIWYDALEKVSNLIETEPANGLLHQLRSSLLTQVGLNQAAAYDTRLASAGN
jgi:hypothetical protein